MIVSVPSSAFGEDPVTGASSMRDVAGGELGADRARLVRRDRRHVDAQRAGLRPLRDAVLAEQHLAHLVAVDDHADDDVAGGADLRGRAGDRPAMLGPHASAVARVRLKTVSA